MDEALEILQNFQAEKHHDAIKLVNLAIHKKDDTIELFLVAFIALIEVRGMRVATDRLREEVQATRGETAKEWIKELQDLLDGKSGGGA